MIENRDEPYFVPASAWYVPDRDTAISNNQVFRQSQKYHFYRNVIDYLTSNNISGSYLEFGVHRARTFTMAMSLDRFYAANSLGQGEITVKDGGGYFDEYVGFDSFQGFPDGSAASEHPMYRPGHTKTLRSEFLALLETYGQNLDRVRIVEGFYSESLTPTLAAEFEDRGTLASFVTIDCNFYESYRDVLCWVDQFLQPGAIVYLDDFNTFKAQHNRGPRRAWGEFVEESRWGFEQFLQVGWFGMSFFVRPR